MNYIVVRNPSEVCNGLGRRSTTGLLNVQQVISILWLSSMVLTGGLRLWGAEEGLVPLLERGCAFSEQLFLSGRASQGVRGVL